MLQDGQLSYSRVNLKNSNEASMIISFSPGVYDLHIWKHCNLHAFHVKSFLDAEHLYNQSLPPLFPFLAYFLTVLQDPSQLLHHGHKVFRDHGFHLNVFWTLIC